MPFLPPNQQHQSTEGKSAEGRFFQSHFSQKMEINILGLQVQQSFSLSLTFGYLITTDCHNL